MEELTPAAAEIEVSYMPKKEVRPYVKSSFDANATFRIFFPQQLIALKEQMVVIYLNSASRVLAVYKVSSGGITGTVADPRLILSVALKIAATGFIIAHNHPSGNAKPSKPDIDLTQKLKEAGKIMDIKLFDHLILMPEELTYFSFADNGLL